MGCSATKSGSSYNVEHEYKAKKLPMPDGTEYENEFEKEAFMMINLMRHEPKHFIAHIKEMKGKLSINAKEASELIIFI